LGFIRSAIVPATKVDPVVFRAYARHFHVLRPPGKLLADAEVVDRARRAVAARPPEAAAPGGPAGPERAALVALLAAAQSPGGARPRPPGYRVSSPGRSP